MTFTHSVASNNFGCAKWIVSANVYEGTHTTIAGALTSASSGDTIFIRPGTYTENPTLKAGVDLVAYTADAYTPNVTIVGTVGAAYSGTATISGITLQTNSANCVSLTGANATTLNLINCNINATNNDGIGSTGSNSAAQLTCYNCIGDIGTTGIKLFAATNGGIELRNCYFTNSGSSTTLSTFSGGSLSMRYTKMNNGFSTSGTTATIGIRHCVFDMNGVDQIIVTHNSTNAGTCQIYDSFFASGASSCVSVGAGAQCQFYDNIVASSNTNAITGSGTLTEANTVFSNTSLTNNVSTLTKKASSGISFDATNTLGTYVVGTFAPNLQFGGANVGITYTTQLGNYVKIGQVVYLNIYIVLSSKGSSTGTATISNLPFASLTQASLLQTIPCSVRAALTVTNFAGMNGQIGSNSSSMTLDAWTTAGANTVLQDTMFANTTAFIAQGFYIAGS